jgi:hypothetical protein
MVFRTWDLNFRAWIFTLAVSNTETWKLLRCDFQDVGSQFWDLDFTQGGFTVAFGCGHPLVGIIFLIFDWGPTSLWRQMANYNRPTFACRKVSWVMTLYHTYHLQWWHMVQSIPLCNIFTCKMEPYFKPFLTLEGLLSCETWWNFCDKTTMTNKEPKDDLKINLKRGIINLEAYVECF